MGVRRAGNPVRRRQRAADDRQPGHLALDAGSHVGGVAEPCDKAYGSLLRSLHPAVGLMFSLEVQARELMAMPRAAGDPATAGLAFQPA